MRADLCLGAKKEITIVTHVHMYEGSGGGSFKCRRVHAGSINAQALIIFSKKKKCVEIFLH